MTTKRSARNIIILTVVVLLLSVGIWRFLTVHRVQQALLTPSTKLSSTEPCTTANLPISACAGVNTNADWESLIQDFDGVPMALVPAGCFQMGSWDGSDHEQPVHEACISEPFWLDVYEVTNTQYGSAGRWTGEYLPRERVDWHAAVAHCKARGGRLPTEAEWEYAARGPNGLNYPWGDEFSGLNTNYCDVSCPYKYADSTFDDGYPRTSPVGTYAAGVSWVGVHDLSGNVWEWMQDRYAVDYYAHSPAIDPHGSNSGAFRVLRGGSWFNQADKLDAAHRFWRAPNSNTDNTGFRCARNATS